MQELYYPFWMESEKWHVDFSILLYLICAILVDINSQNLLSPETYNFTLPLSDQQKRAIKQETDHKHLLNYLLLQ